MKGGNMMMKAFDLKRFDAEHESQIVLLPSELEKMKNQAFESGKKEGIEEGKKEGFALGEQSANEENKKLNAEIVAKIQQKISEEFLSVKNENATSIANIENDFMAILQGIVDKYFNIIAKIDFSEEICNKVRELFEISKIQGKIVIEVNKETEGLMNKFILENLNDFSEMITVKVNLDFTTYDVKISTENGSFERTIADLKAKFDEFFGNYNEEVKNG